MSHHVTIVGGGLSGLAAGVELVSRGLRVTILEQKPALGGRAYSFKDSFTNDIVDNGQHVLILGYERTMHFLDTIGTRDLLRIQPAPSLLFHHPHRGFHEFTLRPLPVPFNLLVAILRCSLFSLPDRIRLLRAGLSLGLLTASHERRLATQTIDQWLRHVGQSDECIRSFWEPLAVSMMNERIGKASALVFVRALNKAFLGGSQKAALAIPSVGLSQLYVDGAKRFILIRGGEIQCNAEVVELSLENGLVAGVKMKNNAKVKADAVIVTVSPQKVVHIFPPRFKEELSHLTAIGSAPIVSIHLWFDKEFMDHEFVGLIGRRIQWLFNKRKINGESGRGAHVSAVISAAYDFVERTKDELVEIAVDDIRGVYPTVGGPRHALVVREKSATYASSPDIEPKRPPHRTVIPNVFLAGDWTATGYPATIEGAIMSAEAASKLALEYCKRKLTH